MVAVAAAVVVVHGARPRPAPLEAEAALRPPRPSLDTAVQLEAVVLAAVGLLVVVAPPPPVEEEAMDKVEGADVVEAPHAVALAALRKSSLSGSRCSSSRA